MKESILTLRTEYVFISHCMQVYTFYIRIVFFLLDKLCNDSVHTHII